MSSNLINTTNYINTFNQLNTNQLIEIIKLLHYWVLDQEKSCLSELMETIPQSIIDEYTLYYPILYRGMITKSNESTYSELYCSWTTDKDTAQSFREKESIHEQLHYEIDAFEEDAYIIDSLYFKSDHGFNLHLFIDDLAHYIKCMYKSELYNDIESEIAEVLLCDCLSDAIEILLDFQHEKEIISPFDIDSVECIDYLIS